MSHKDDMLEEAVSILDRYRMNVEEKQILDEFLELAEDIEIFIAEEIENDGQTVL